MNPDFRTAMRFAPYAEEREKWPVSGRHIMAQWDREAVIVYQAYRPAIARYAVQHQVFGGEFSYNRMSWIKPNFLWMMYRSGWAAKEGQEHVLAIRLARAFFEKLLLQSVASSFDASRFSDHDEWKAAVAGSDVRLQWDPDHGPSGNPLERRAVQLGLRGAALQRFGKEALAIYDITPFVAAEREHLREASGKLTVPVERVYVPDDPLAATAVGLDADPFYSSAS
ncbi:MAG: DUF4291 domain-containing protein [Verrucomicrobiota bacterium]